MSSDHRPLTKEEIQEYKEAFAIFDTNDDGSIEAKELKEVLLKLGLNPTTKEINDMISTVDGDENGSIDFDEFLILMRSRQTDPDQELWNAFKIFDTNNDGAISRKELTVLMTRLGQKLSETEIDAMMHLADENQDGEISFDEFKKMMRS